MEYVKSSYVKEFINNAKDEEGRPCRMGGDFVETLNAEINDIIVRSIKRANANGRVTVEGKDL